VLGGVGAIHFLSNAHVYTVQQARDESRHALRNATSFLLDTHTLPQCLIWQLTLLNYIYFYLFTVTYAKTSVRTSEGIRVPNIG